jgi:hypothetical protein
MLPHRRKAFKAGPTAVVWGLNTIAANADTWGADTAIFMRSAAPITGTLSKAYIYVNNTAVVLAKVVVYGPDTDSTPNVEDAQIGITGIITASGTAGWQPAAGAVITGSVVSGQQYWMGILLSTASPTWAVRTENASGLGYVVSSGFYAAPPATLNGVTLGGGTYGRISCYIEILP